MPDKLHADSVALGSGARVKQGGAYATSYAGTV
ncbi:hypothetical protein JOE11_004338 [Robbsia andropogonis]